IGAIAPFIAATGQGRPAAGGPIRKLMGCLRSVFVGAVPHVSRFHPRRRDYRMLMAACEELTGPSSRLLIEAGDVTGIAKALRHKVPNAASFSLRAASPIQPITDVGDQKYDAVFIGLVNEDLGDIAPRLSRPAAALRPGGQIVLAMLNIDGTVDLEHAGRVY